MTDPRNPSQVVLSEAQPASASLTPVVDVDEAPRTLTERAYRALRQDIVRGDLPPGCRLRVEHLRQQYGVGAGTLREALALLLSDALVTMEGQRGYRVSRISLQDLRDLTDTRVMLETHALRQSIRQGDEHWKAQLREAYAELSRVEEEGPGQDPQRWELANQRFHERLIGACDSAWTLHLLSVLYRHGERYRHVAIRLGAMRDVQRDVHAEHSAIYEAAMGKQEARAALALEAHIRLTCDILTRMEPRIERNDWLPSQL